MTSRVTVEVSPSTLRALLDYLAEKQGEHELSALAGMAIREWLQRQRAGIRFVERSGYHWKTVFLPDGTRLRVEACDGAHYAEIVGAGRLVYLQLPGESDWTPAFKLRYAAADHALRTAKRKAETVSPAPDHKEKSANLTSVQHAPDFLK